MKTTVLLSIGNGLYLTMFLLGFIIVLLLGIYLCNKPLNPSKNLSKRFRKDRYIYPEIPKSRDEFILEEKSRRA